MRYANVYHSDYLTDRCHVKLSFIGKDLNAPKTQTWIADSILLVGAVLSPLLATISDTFQARKSILVGTCTVAFIGAAIAPGSSSIGRLIAAQVLIGVGFANTPLGYTVPSEILPRRWRPSMSTCASMLYP